LPGAAGHGPGPAASLPARSPGAPAVVIEATRPGRRPGRAGAGRHGALLRVPGAAPHAAGGDPGLVAACAGPARAHAPGHDQLLPVGAEPGARERNGGLRLLHGDRAQPGTRAGAGRLPGAGRLLMPWGELAFNTVALLVYPGL